MLFLTVNPFLIAAAVIPAVFLLRYIYKQDKLEPEPPGLILSLVIYGALSTALALIAEVIGDIVLSLFYAENSLAYQLLMNFLVVGFSEEAAKYLLLKKRTWNNPNFNCRFDGMIYAVTVSLGFALWENIRYVLSYGMATALMRAVTAVPGHASFGVFMGCFYGLGKQASRQGRKVAVKRYCRLAVLIPMLLHGSYDFIASTGYTWVTVPFAAFVGGLFLAAFLLVRGMSKNDRYFH